VLVKISLKALDYIPNRDKKCNGPRAAGTNHNIVFDSKTEDDQDSKRLHKE
jgi:hypothetical protein